MATKKAVSGEEMMNVMLEAAKDAEQEQQAGVVDEWKIMKEIYIPKRTRSEQNTIKVLVNSRSMFVPLDKRVQVPLPVYNVLMQSMEARKQMEDQADELFGGSAIPQ